MSKKYLPGMAKGFFSPKLTLHVGDGFEFMKKNQDAFDVIITDSSDPVGKFIIRSLFTVSHHRRLLMKLFALFVCRPSGKFVQRVVLSAHEGSIEKWWNSVFPG